MNYSTLKAMRFRIERARCSVQTASGISYATSYQANGQDFITNFKAIGIKAPEQLEDDFLALFVWVWSLKDYIKEAFEARGLRSALVEDEVNACPALTYVADIANRAKHGTLKSSRSGRHAELVDVGFTVPQDAVARIIFAGSDVTLDVKNFEQAEIHAWVSVEMDVRIDALAVLSEAMNCWETKLLPQIAV